MTTTESIYDFATANPEIATPYYLVDESLLQKNLEKIAYVREKSGAKAVLALKCFSTWSVFPLMSKYMDGTTSSSLYEARLGHEKFGGETQAYSVIFTDEEVREARKFGDKISGLVFHVNCENADFAAFSKILGGIGASYGELLRKMDWVSLGGGIAFTGDGYPLDDFAARLKKFAEEFGVQVYLEPGDAAVTMAGFLVT